MYNLNSLFTSNNIFLYSCARHAFKVSLQLLNLNQDDTVLMPSFICRDLLSSIYENNLRIKFYSVNKNLEPEYLPVDSNIKAVLAVNYFGFPQDLEIFRTYCKKNNCTLIEDNAHGFLSFDQEGTELGRRTNIGFTSFRKIVSVFDGSALFINDYKIQKSEFLKLSPSDARLPFRFILKKFSRLIQRNMNIPLIIYLEDLSRLMRLLLTGSRIPKPLKSAEKIIGRPINIHSSSIATLKQLAATLDEERKRRRNLYVKFLEILEDYEVELIFSKLIDNVSPYGLPFIDNNNNIIGIKKIARENGFTCEKWPDLPISIMSSCPDFYKNIYFIDFLE